MPPTASDRPRVARRPLSQLPTFALYGEEGEPAPSMLHIESIDSRSRLHDWEIDAHRHQGLHQVLWLRSGQVDAMLDETRSTCQAPAVLLVPPGVVHAFRFAPHSDGYVLTVNAGLLAEGETAAASDALQLAFAAPRTATLEAASPEADRLQALFAALHTESNAADSADGPVPLWLTRAIVWRLAQRLQRDLQTGPRVNAGRQSLYTRWLVLVEAHYRAHWPVARYADSLGLSTERLNRIVRAETGHNAQHLLHARLVREACRRLVHVVAPVSKLAFELGFDDPAYFSRFFKRHAGLSPSDYRARARQA